MDIAYILTPFGFALIATIMLIPVWISVCRKFRLFDEPDERKHHTVMVPSMGGIAIFAGIFCSFLVFGQVQDNTALQYLLGAVLILFFTGFFDDLINVSPLKKIIFQSVSTIIAFYAGFRIDHLGGILGIYEIPEVMQLPLTLWFVVLFTNAYNFIDGADGLAGSIGVIMSSSLGAVFYHYGIYDYSILCFCITGALLGFLFYNFSPAKIFMGDTGSLVIGFTTAILAVKLLNPEINSGVEKVSPAYLVAALFIPLFDFIRVVILRSSKGYSPFKADRNHIHHLILKQGFGHRSVAIIMASFHLMIMSLHHLMVDVSVNLFMVIATLAGILFFNQKTISALASVRGFVFGEEKRYTKQ